METTGTNQLRVKPPFVSDFGGFPIVERGEWLYCVEKNVRIHKDLLLAAVKQSAHSPIGEKFIVGVPIVGGNGEKLHYWRDQYTTYIGCLDEPTSVFNKKYQQLVKHLNNK